MTIDPAIDLPGVTVHRGDCLAILSAMPAESVHAVVTDPPYELAFMGRKWDASGITFNVDVWRECLRVLKPGGHLLAFGGSRTWHRLAVAIEDAGFEMRDSIAWMYGSGFPKSRRVSADIDRILGAKRSRVPLVGGALNSGTANGWNGSDPHSEGAKLAGTRADDQPLTEEAQQWNGWGTALKPAFEPIVVARKSLSGTVAATVLEHGTGALNIDACRISGAGYSSGGQNRSVAFGQNGLGEKQPRNDGSAGRWPTNVVLDGDAADELDEQSGITRSKSSAGRQTPKRGTSALGDFVGTDKVAGHDDSGGASRFFPVFRYQAKAPAKERPKVDGIAHPTVKPLELMRWLVRLVTPAGGTVLDPFLGSGTTAQAARDEGFVCLGIERESDYMRLIAARLAAAPVEAPPPPPVDQVSLLDLSDEEATA